MKRREEKKRSLSSGETLVMKVIWDTGEEMGRDITVPELTEALFRDYGKDYSRTAIASFLDKLIEKGFIEKYREGRLAYLHPFQDEEEYKRKMLLENTNFWFRGKVSSLVAALDREQKISEEEAEKIRKILDGVDR